MTDDMIATLRVAAQQTESPWAFDLEGATQLGRRRVRRRRMIRSAAAVAVVAGFTAASLTLWPGSAFGPAEPSIESLDDFLMVPQWALVEEREREDGRRYAYEESVASCMSDLGFEYVPHAVESVVEARDRLREELGDDEFRRRYGFGISTLEWQDVVGWGYEGDQADPNAEIWDGLSADQRRAYEIALWGDSRGSTLGEERTSGGSSYLENDDYGCVGEAQAKVTGSHPGELNDAERDWQPLWDEVYALRSRVEADPRVVNAETQYLDCLAEMGFGEAQGDLTGHLEARLSRVIGLAEWYEEHGDLDGFVPSPDPDEVADLQAEEILMAAADFDCRVERDSVLAEVNAEYEHHFIEQNRPALIAYQQYIYEKYGISDEVRDSEIEDP